MGNNKRQCGALRRGRRRWPMDDERDLRWASHHVLTTIRFATLSMTNNWPINKDNNMSIAWARIFLDHFWFIEYDVKLLTVLFSAKRSEPYRVITKTNIKKLCYTNDNFYGILISKEGERADEKKENEEEEEGDYKQKKDDSVIEKEVRSAVFWEWPVCLSVKNTMKRIRQMGGIAHRN